MLNLIQGPFKSGKTAYVLNIIKHDIASKSNPLVIVPTRILRDEFMSLLAEETGGFAGKIVYTLGEFMQTVLLLAKNYPGQISDFESYIIVRMIIEKNKKKFGYFRDIDSYGGVIKLIYSLIMELRAGSTIRGCSDIKKCLPDNGKNNRIKWNDIFLIYDEYENMLIKTGLNDNYSLFMEASGEILRLSPIPWSLLVIDGFFDFTATEFEFIKNLTTAFERENKRAFLTLPSLNSPLIRKTFDDLKIKFKLDITRMPSPNNPFSILSGAILEGKLEGKMPELNISVIRAFGKYREIEKIANEIKRLKIAHKVNYGEMGLIIRNMGQYSNIIKSVFSRFDIPYYNTMDEPLKDNPAIIFLFYICESAFKDGAIDSIRILSIVNSNYTANPSFKILSSLTEVIPSFIKADREGWLKTCESRERYYREKRNKIFINNEGNEISIEELGRKINSISRIRDTLDEFLALILPQKGPISIDDFIIWFSRLTGGLGMEETLGGDGEEGSGFAARDFTAFRKLKDTLSSIRKSLKLLEINLFSNIELFSLIENLIQNTSYRYQYYPYDAVKIGVPFDMRESSRRAVFIAGLNEGEFPPGVPLSLINGQEKRRINGLASKIIFQDEEHTAISARLEFALAVSRCTEFLYLSATPYDESGREIISSLYLQDIEKMIFPEKNADEAEPFIFEIVPSSRWMEIFDFQTLISHDFDLLDVTIKKEILRENQGMERAMQMKNYFDLISGINMAYRLDISPVKTGLSYFGDCRENSDWIADKIKKLTFSSSLLESFGNCRYHFLLRYLLKIRSDQYPSQKIESTLKGSFYHAVLKDYILETSEKSSDFLLGNKKKMFDVLDSCIERNFSEFANLEGEKELFEMEMENYRSFLREFIEFDAEKLRDYKPILTEHPVNSVLEIGEGYLLPITGSIDRIDSSDGGERSSLRIIDYKTGSVSHFKKDYFIPLKIFQGFIYAWSLDKPVSEISFVSIEKKGKERKMDVLPFSKGDHSITDFKEIWKEKISEIMAAFSLIMKGDFKPVTLETDYNEDILTFYKNFSGHEGSVDTESDLKCEFCPYTSACPRSDKLFSN